MYKTIIPMNEYFVWLTQYRDNLTAWCQVWSPILSREPLNLILNHHATHLLSLTTNIMLICKHTHTPALRWQNTTWNMIFCTISMLSVPNCPDNSMRSFCLALRDPYDLDSCSAITKTCQTIGFALGHIWGCFFLSQSEIQQSKHWALWQVCHWYHTFHSVVTASEILETDTLIGPFFFLWVV